MTVRLRPARSLWSLSPLLLAVLAGVLLGAGCTRSTLVATRPASSFRGEVQKGTEETRSLKELSVAELLQRGNYALSEGNSALAQSHFAQVLEKEPESRAARLGLAQVALATGDRRNARTLVEQVLEEEPEASLALLLHGRLLRDQGEIAAATADFSLALRQAPDDPLLLSELAMTCDRNPARLGEAETHYRRVVTLLPDSAVARNNLGFNLLLQGRAAEAAATLTSALQLDPKNPRILGNLATAQLLLGEDEKALQLFRRTVSEAKAYNNLGYLYMTQGQWDRAEAAYARALELDPRFYVRADANRKTLLGMRERESRGAAPPAADGHRSRERLN